MSAICIQKLHEYTNADKSVCEQVLKRSEGDFWTAAQILCEPEVGKLEILSQLKVFLLGKDNEQESYKLLKYIEENHLKDTIDQIQEKWKSI